MHAEHGAAIVVGQTVGAKGVVTAFNKDRELRHKTIVVDIVGKRLALVGRAGFDGALLRRVRGTNDEDVALEPINGVAFVGGGALGRERGGSAFGTELATTRLIDLRRVVVWVVAQLMPQQFGFKLPVGTKLTNCEVLHDIVGSLTGRGGAAGKVDSGSDGDDPIADKSQSAHKGDRQI